MNNLNVSEGLVGSVKRTVVGLISGWLGRMAIDPRGCWFLVFYEPTVDLELLEEE